MRAISATILVVMAGLCAMFDRTDLAIFVLLLAILMCIVDIDLEKGGKP